MPLSGCGLFISGNDSCRSNICGLILIIVGYVIQLNYPIWIVFSENGYTAGGGWVIPVAEECLALRLQISAF